MALKFPPPPTLASKDPQTQQLNRWLIEIQSILNSDGTVNIGDSPVLTGVPTAPTAANGTDTSQIATTAFVINNAGTASTTVPLVDATPGQVGTSTHFARGDHVHPTDTSRAALASPTFTGTPAAPTAAPGTNTTQLATTAFVAAADALLAPLASPTLTGVPKAPTAAPGTNTTQLATTAFVEAAVPALSGDAAAKAWITFTSTTGAPLSSFNASVARNSVGNYTVTFPVPFTTANYAAFITSCGIFIADIISQTASTLTFQTTTLGGALADGTFNNVVCFGR